MQVLMTDMATEQERSVRSLLEAMGHDVVTCGDGTGRTVTCAALRGRPCPLEGHGVEVALHLEGKGPVGLEDEGLLCALRHFLPVVVVASDPAAPDPLGGLATAMCTLDDLGEALAAAATAPLPAHSVAAERAANAVLTGSGRAPTWKAVVRREGRRLVLELASDVPVSPQLCSRSAVRAEGAVRAIDAVSPSVDVEIALGSSG